MCRDKRLQEAIKYILENDSDNKIIGHELAHIIFLLDWKYALDTEKPFSKIKWVVNKNNEVYSKQLISILDSLKEIEVDKLNDCYKDWVLHLSKSKKKSKLSDQAKKFIDYTLLFSKNYNHQLDNLVKKTYPVFSYHSDTESELDLHELSKDYKDNVRPKLKNVQKAESYS